MFPKKATKTDEDFINFCGLIRKHELYQSQILPPGPNMPVLVVDQIQRQTYGCSSPLSMSLEESNQKSFAKFPPKKLKNKKDKTWTVFTGYLIAKCE